MRIFIDADASPVRKIVVEIAKKHHIPLTMISNINHEINEEYGEIIKVDQGFDSADHKIVELCQKGDLVITQDYGLAALILGKNAYAMHQDGWLFTNHNIDMLLMRRHHNHVMRKASKRTPHIPKRKAVQNKHFEENILLFLKEKGVI